MRPFLKSSVLHLTVLLALTIWSCKPQQPIAHILEEFHNPNSSYVMVAAHRAAHNGYLENSLPAIRHAIELGVDIIELDVKVTTDGVVVINHDRTIDRTTNGTGDPEAYAWKELQQFRLEMPDGTLTNERIATFKEALLLVKGKAMIDIDIKTSHLKPIVDVITQTDTWDHIFFFDNDYLALQEVRDRQPHAMLMPRAYSYQMADSALLLFKPPVVHIDHSFYTEEVCQLIQNQGARIWLNALGTQDSIIRSGTPQKALDNLLKYQANIIQTDEPELLIPTLEAIGRRTSSKQ
ncbi:glycerophosphodiester phosphodiesterase family protein [Sunxiuqinia elliptica]